MCRRESLRTLPWLFWALLSCPRLLEYSSSSFPFATADIAEKMWAENYETTSPAPVLVAEGEQVTIPCTVMTHSWPMVSIRARFCRSHDGSDELILDAVKGHRLMNGLQYRLPYATWNFSQLHLGQIFSLTFNVSTDTAGMYECVLRNYSHGLIMQRFVILTQLETLSRPDEPCCTPALGRYSLGDQIWSPTPWRLRNHDCGMYRGFQRNYFYIGRADAEDCWKPACPDEEPDRCWTVIQRYRLPGDCYRSQPHPPKFLPVTPAPPADIDTGMSPWATRGIAAFLGFWSIFTVCFLCYLCYLQCCGRWCPTPGRGRRGGEGYRRLPTYDSYPGVRKMKR
ncbi:membrane glycoprotein UL141 [Human betaherpesvirus 5]|nr:membrane glycoprotein UL141 [Human betaherpesvirus 5]